MLPKWKYRVFMSPEVGDTGGTAVTDRGDSFSPPADDAAASPEGEAAAAEALEAELATKTPEESEKTADTDKPDSKKDNRIPLSRHEKILQKERDARGALERELKKYQTGAQVADLNSDITKTEDIVLGLEKEYAKLITDGESDKAAEKMAEIRRTERQMSEAKSDLKIQAAVARATESARYDIALERIETQYPELNPDHEDFSEESYGEVVELMNGYKAQGYTPTEAMQKAVRKELGAQTAAQAKTLDVAPRVDAKDVAAARKREAAIKTADALNKTPPITTKVGLDGDKVGGGLSAKAVMGMNQKDFSKLSEESLARFRGDEL